MRILKQLAALPGGVELVRYQQSGESDGAAAQQAEERLGNAVMVAAVRRVRHQGHGAGQLDHLQQRGSAVPVWLFGPRAPEIPLFPLLCGLAAVIGHVFSVFVGFKGGKGVATSAGVVLALAPWALLAVTVVWALLVWLTGYVSLASIVAAALFPLAAWLLHDARGGALLADIAPRRVHRVEAPLQPPAAGGRERRAGSARGEKTAGEGGRGREVAR